MHLYVVIAFMLIIRTAGVPPMRLPIDCSHERNQPIGSFFRLPNYKNRNSGSGLKNSFCNLIRNAIPKAVEDGKFILIDPDSDQEGFSDTHVPMAIAPPKGFISALESSKLKIPKLRTPKLEVPKLQGRSGLQKAPRVGSPMTFISSMSPKEESSAEKMEKLKKGVQKMLNFVKVLGQIDHYVSERIRIIVEKLSKTFAE